MRISKTAKSWFEENFLIMIDWLENNCVSRKKNINGTNFKRKRTLFLSFIRLGRIFSKTRYNFVYL